jgi:hypothetical protein
VQKVRKNVRNEPVFIGKKIPLEERAGPLNWWPVPLIIKGTALIIKEATPS